MKGNLCAFVMYMYSIQENYSKRIIHDITFEIYCMRRKLSGQYSIEVQLSAVALKKFPYSLLELP